MLHFLFPRFLGEEKGSHMNFFNNIAFKRYNKNQYNAIEVRRTEWFIAIIGADIRKGFIKEVIFTLYIKVNINKKGRIGKDSYLRGHGMLGGYSKV